MKKFLRLGLLAGCGMILPGCSVTRPAGDPLAHYADRTAEYLHEPAFLDAPPAPPEPAPAEPVKPAEPKIETSPKGGAGKAGDPTPTPAPAVAKNAEPPSSSVTEGVQKGREIEASYNFLFRQKYDQYRELSLRTGTGHLVARKQLRNEVMSKLMVVIDNYFYRFEARMTGGRAWSGLASSVAALGLNTAGAVTGGAELKAILAATAAAVQGVELASEKRIFQEQGPYLIVSYMRSNRQTCKTRIRQRMFLEDTDYSLDDGLSDMVEYFNSGTIISGLNTAMADAENRRKTSADSLQESYDTLIQKSGVSQFLIKHGQKATFVAQSFSDSVIKSNSDLYSSSASVKYLGGPLMIIPKAFKDSALTGTAGDAGRKIKGDYAEFIKQDVKRAELMEGPIYIREGSGLMFTRKLIINAETSLLDTYTLQEDDKGNWLVIEFQRGEAKVSDALKKAETETPP